MLQPQHETINVQSMYGRTGHLLTAYLSASVTVLPRFASAYGTCAAEMVGPWAPLLKAAVITLLPGRVVSLDFHGEDWPPSSAPRRRTRS